MVTYISDNIEELQVYSSVLQHESVPYGIEDVSSIDVTLLPLKQKAWEFNKGKRDVRNYLDENDNLVCRFRYEYEFEPNSNIVSGFTVHIEWFDLNGNIGLVKVKEKELSRKYLTTFNREVRQNQIDYLMGAGKGFREDAANYSNNPTLQAQLIAFADIVDSLWIRYETHIFEYVNTGGGDLYTTIESEATVPYSIALDKVDPETNLTMRQTILNEIS